MGGEEVGEEEGRARKASSGPAWGGSGVGEVGSVRGPYSHRSRTLGRLQSRVRDIPPYPPVSRLVLVHCRDEGQWCGGST